MQHVKIMKIIKTVFFTICLIVFNVCSVVAQGGTLPPPNDSEDPDIVPIDGHIVLMLILAIVLGGIMIYRHKIKKASM